MKPSRRKIKSLYRKRAARYNFTANLYYLIGLREWAYRKKAVEALHLAPGDTVVEIGCGTGLNFSLLEKAVGPKGKIIGVDLTDKMLSQAEKRVRANKWNNVELVQSDAARFEFPRGIGGMISTFAITLIPEYDEIIKDASKALLPGKRLVILDIKEPAGNPRWLTKLGVLLSRPFGVTLELAEHHPWESVKRYLNDFEMDEYYFGFVYVASGKSRQSKVADRGVHAKSLGKR